MEYRSWIISIPIMLIVLMPATSSLGVVIIDDDFSSSTISNGSSVTVNSTNNETWWGESNWTVSGGYATASVKGGTVTSALAYFADDFSSSDEQIDISFEHRWVATGSTPAASYAIYGWNTNDSISLTSTTPGSGTALLGPVSLAESDVWTTITDSATSLDLSSFDYVGLFLRHTTHSGGGSQSTIDTDDQYGTTVPEPATFGMLAMGGLFLLRRGRRRI